jgi:hypothetical protein
MTEAKMAQKHQIKYSDKQRCAYCGHVRKTDGDHVVARCLFTQGLPPTGISKVPACKNCHSEKSLCDQALRDALIADFSMEGHEAQIKLLPKLVRAFGRKQSILTAKHLEAAEMWDIKTKKGIIVGQGLAMRMEHDRISKAIEYIVRGLYYGIRGVSLDSECSVKCQRLMPGEDISTFNDLRSKINLEGPTTMGNTFGYFWAYAEEEPRTTIWFLVFYSRICYWAMTRFDKSTQNHTSSTDSD